MSRPNREKATAGRTPLLEVRGLSTVFDTEEGVARAVDGASFEVREGEVLGLVGESGCGKSVTALSILRLIPKSLGRIVDGRVVFQGIDLMQSSGDEMRQVRGNQISMVFQEPMSSLNPVFTCGEQVAEMFRVHQGISRREASERAVQMLRRVHLPDPQHQARKYPHQLSGGMQQRVMIAMALACKPRLLIADEPTTALDVTIQAQILDLLRELQGDEGMAILLITHDLGVVAELAQRIAVMYAGKVIENGSVQQVFETPRHPYTKALVDSLPRLTSKQSEFSAIPGTLPHPARLPKHCRFQARCAYHIERCAQEEPPLRFVAPQHAIRCFVDLDGGASG